MSSRSHHCQHLELAAGGWWASQVVLVVKNRLLPESERSPGGGHGYPLQYSHLENPMDRGAWQDTVHRITESDKAEVT